MQSTVDIQGTYSLDAAPAPTFRAGAVSDARTEAWRQRLVKLTLVFSDMVLALFIWGIAYVMQILWNPGYLTGAIVLSVVPIVLVWVGLRAMQGLYPGYGMDEAEELKRQTYALLATVAIAGIFALAFQVGSLVLWFLLSLTFAALLFLSPLVRYLVKRSMVRRGVWGKPVVILGAGDPGVRLEESLLQESTLGFKPVARIERPREDELTKEKASDEEREPAYRDVSDACKKAIELGRERRIDTIFLAMPHLPSECLAMLADAAGVHFRNVVVIPDLAGGISDSTAVTRNLGGTLGVDVRHNLLDPWGRGFKRTLDLIGALFGGLLISPLLIALALLIKLDSPGPVFFRHERLGNGGKHFRCLKFRTMHPDAEQLLVQHLKENPHLRVEWERDMKLHDDPRVTRFGRLLRKTSLDELPQLWNVVRGEMSLVGPRPPWDEQITSYREAYRYGDAYDLFKRVKPGMTGFWQVSGRNETDWETHVTMDAHYVHNWSIWLDLVILARTVPSVLFSRGAC